MYMLLFISVLFDYRCRCYSVTQFALADDSYIVQTSRPGLRAVLYHWAGSLTTCCPLPTIHSLFYRAV